MVPTTIRPPRSITAASRTTTPAPQRSIRWPLAGIPTIDPMAMLRSNAPRAPLDRSNDSRRSGTRDARVAKQKPLSANTRATAFRAAVALARWWADRGVDVTGGSEVLGAGRGGLEPGLEPHQGGRAEGELHDAP